MKLLVTGARGQLGWELARTLQPLGEVLALDRLAADLSQPQTLPEVIRAIRPDVIVNAAAYTAVDKAESEEALAACINGEAVDVIGREARALGALLVHYSTDYVFDGSKQTPYSESDTAKPLNAYGRSKRAGEEALLASAGDWLILRTTWIYAARGNNFLRTMLRLARERETLRVVSDQTGAPTSARWLAEMSAVIVAKSLEERSHGSFRSGLYHCSAGGQTSWFEFATAIIESARYTLGSDQVRTRQIDPIPTSEYPLPAPRPMNSVLDMTELTRRFGLQRSHWKVGMDLVLDEVFAASR